MPLLTLVCLSLSSFAQDSITVTFQGKSLEFQKQEPIVNTRIETNIFINKTSLTKDIITDDKGEFVFRLRVPKKPSSVSLDMNALKSGYSNHYLYTFSCKGNDTTIQLNMQLNRERVCKDTWLPETIYFDENISAGTQESFSGLVNFISFYEENKTMLKGKKIHVSAYNSFSEKSKIAKDRANYVHAFLLEYGLKEDDFVIEVMGKKELVHYYYTSGCHTEKEFEEKIDLSKSSYKKASTEQKKEINTLRQSIRFNWK